MNEKKAVRIVEAKIDFSFLTLNSAEFGNRMSTYTERFIPAIEKIL